MKIKKFSDFATNDLMVGDKIKIDEILGIEITIKGFKISDSKFNKGNDNKLLTLQIELEGEDRIIFTGSNILIEQSEKYEDNMPFMTTIQKVNNFYTFT